MPSIQRRTKTSSKPADWHYADVQAALTKAGWTYRKLAAANGYSKNFDRIPRGWRSLPVERIIAAAIGLKPEQIWPSRYQGDRRVYRDRWGPKGTRRRTHPSSAAARRNISEPAAN